MKVAIVSADEGSRHLDTFGGLHISKACAPKGGRGAEGNGGAIDTTTQIDRRRAQPSQVDDECAKIFERCR